MKKRRVVLITILLVAVGGITASRLARLVEPAYRGKTLSRWLDAYNEAGSLEKTEPVSDAIRAMGTNCLPFLLANLERRDSRLQAWLIIWNAVLRLKLPLHSVFIYRSPSVLAFTALGPRAARAFPDLRRIAENPQTSQEGLQALMAIGPASTPTLATIRRSTNVEIRSCAAYIIAMLHSHPSPLLSWSWEELMTFRGKSLLVVRFPVTGTDSACMELVNMLDDPDPTFRRAAADALPRYVRTFGSTAKLAIPRLAAAVNDSDASVRRAAREALLLMKPAATSSVEGK